MIERNARAERDDLVGARESIATAAAARIQTELQSDVDAVRSDPSIAERRLWCAPDGRIAPQPLARMPLEEPCDPLFETSIRGGDAYVARGELGRAIDAYAFAIPKLSDEACRDRLRLRLGRAVLARADRFGNGADAKLGRRVLEELVDRPSRAREESFPIVLLARFALATHGHSAALPSRESLLEALDELPLSVVESAARRVATPSPDALTRALAARRELEAAIRDRFDRLQAGRSVYAELGSEGCLLVPLVDPAAASTSRVLTAPDIEAPDFEGPNFEAPSDGLDAIVDRNFPVAVRRRPVARAPKLSSRYPSAWVPGRRSSPGRLSSPVEGAVDSSGGDVSIAAVVLDGAVAGRVRTIDENYATSLAELARREAVMSWGLIAVLVVTGFALLATWAAIDRQRRLAELKVRLLANVSHELKTPVTSLRMLGELLADPKLPHDRIEEFAHRVTREARRLGRRIEDILETARDPRQRQPIDRQPVDVVPVVREVVAGFQVRAQEQHIRLEFIADAERMVLPSDAGAIERVVENLIDNAFKYGLPKPRREEGAEIRVALSQGKTELTVAVEDEGPGVAQGDRERIFDSFYRAAFQDYGVPGTGLGLAISRSLARRLGGRLDYERVPTGGSRFMLILPMAEDRATGGEDGRSNRSSSKPTARTHEAAGESS